MKYFIVIVFIICCIGHIFVQPEKHTTKSAIGSIYSEHVTELPAFKNYTEDECALLRPTESNYGICLAKKSDQYVLILDTLFKTVNKTRFKVLAIKNLGAISQGQKIVPIECRLNKRADSDIIAVVKDSEKKYLTAIIKAWKIDRVKHAIKIISTKYIDCLNESYGI